MPRANVYIRKYNWLVWQAIEDKSDWVNKQLEKVDGPRLTLKEQKLLEAASEPSERRIVGKLPKEPINTPEQAKKAIQALPKVADVKFCPNGHAIPPGRTSCMGKGCKYAK